MYADGGRQLDALTATMTCAYRIDHGTRQPNVIGCAKRVNSSGCRKPLFMIKDVCPSNVPEILESPVQSTKRCDSVRLVGSIDILLNFLKWACRVPKLYDRG